MLDSTKKDEFMNLFPIKQRGPFGNKILEQIRAGEKIHTTIANKVYAKLKPYPNNRDTVNILLDNPFMFLDAILYYLEYECLSHSNKEILKQSKSKEYIEEYMREQPITDKQKWKLQSLGYAGPFDISKLGARNIIEELLI